MSGGAIVVTAGVIRWAAILLAVLCAGYAILVAALWLLQARIVYQPARTVHARPDAVGLAYEPVALVAEDGVRLAAWWVPAPDACGAIVFCHGNAGNIGHRLETLRTFRALGMSTLIFDYRGYGESEGTPGEEGTYIDAMAAWRHVVETRGVPPKRIAVFGRSIGGAIAAELARRFATTSPPGALVVESAFTSIPDLAAELYPFFPARWLARFRYPTIDRVRDVRSPVLVLHSPADELIPASHGRRIYDAAPEPKAFVALVGGHNEGWSLAGEAYTRALDAFFAAHVGGRRANP